MPRYYFHTRSPLGLAHDDDGLELDNLEQAHSVAAFAIREAIIEMVYQGEIRLDDAIGITDTHGVTVLVVRYSDVVKVIGGSN